MRNTTLLNSRLSLDLCSANRSWDPTSTPQPRGGQRNPHELYRLIPQRWWYVLKDRMGVECLLFHRGM